jgi:hypothetical protein
MCRVLPEASGQLQKILLCPRSLISSLIAMCAMCCVFLLAWSALQ